jgi:hypothetical protein
MHEKEDWLFSFLAQRKENIETVSLGRSITLISNDTDILRRLFIEWFEEHSPFLRARDQLNVRKSLVSLYLLVTKVEFDRIFSDFCEDAVHNCLR